jgi:carbonic anhydrase
MCLLCGLNGAAIKPSINRRDFIAGGVGAISSFPARGATRSVPPKPQNAISPDAALERLLEGNRRFRRGGERRQDFRAEREALLGGQNPFAAVLSCADSRLAPAYIFDSELGDLFNIRIAGNFAAPEVIASFEYAVLKLNTPLLMVLGHEKCGAVEAALETARTGHRLPGHLPVLAEAIAPALEGAGTRPQEDMLSVAINHNIQLNVQKIKASAPILDVAALGKKIRVVGGLYRLESGRVEIPYP